MFLAGLCYNVIGQKRKQNGIPKLMTTCKVTPLMKKVMAGVHGNTLRCCMKKAGTWMFSILRASNCFRK